MAGLPKDPKQQKALIAILVLVGAGYAYWNWMHKPVVVELDATRTRVETLEEANRRAQLLATRGGADLEERMALYERHVMELERLIPQNEEIATLLNDIQSEARRANVEVITLTPEPEQPGEFYTLQAFTMRIIGDYHNVARFVTAIASMSRIITPVELDVTPFDDTQNLYPQFEAPVTASFRIETYVIPPAAEPAAAVGGSTAGAAP